MANFNFDILISIIYALLQPWHVSLRPFQGFSSVILTSRKLNNHNPNLSHPGSNSCKSILYCSTRHPVGILSMTQILSFYTSAILNNSYICYWAESANWLNKHLGSIQIAVLSVFFYWIKKEVESILRKASWGRKWCGWEGGI